MAEIWDYNIVDDSNTARFPEGQAPSTVNNGARANEGITARAYNDTNGSLTTTGTASAYVLTPTRTMIAYFQGMTFSAKAHVTSAATPTLNVGAQGASTIKWPNGTPLVAGDIPQDSIFTVVHDGTDWQLKTVSLAGDIAYLGRTNTFTETPQTLSVSDDAATAGPTIIIKRDRTTPAANDELGLLQFDGVGGSTNNEVWGSIRGRILDPTSASEDGALIIQTVAGGALADRVDIRKGLIVPNESTFPTGDDPGAGSINVAGQVQSNGVEYQKGWDYTSEVAASGTSTDIITTLPANISEIEVFGKALVTGTNNQIGKVEIGDGTFQTSGYFTTGGTLSGASQNTIYGTDSFRVTDTGAWDSTFELDFLLTLSLKDPTTHEWWGKSTGHLRTRNVEVIGFGLIDLTNRIERIRFSTSGGTLTAGALQARYR